MPWLGMNAARSQGHVLDQLFPNLSGKKGNLPAETSKRVVVGSSARQDVTAFRELNFSVSVGDDKGYLAVENNFDSVEFSFAKGKTVQNTVTLSMEELQALIPRLQVIADSAETFGKR